MKIKLNPQSFTHTQKKKRKERKGKEKKVESRVRFFSFLLPLERREREEGL